MKRTESNVYPAQTQLLQGVLLVNYDVQEISKEGEIVYNYAQDRLQQDAPESDITKAIEFGTKYWERQRKNTALDTLVITTDTTPFDANVVSVSYMSSVLAIANFKTIQMLASGMSVTDAYNSVYKTLVNWKCADNVVSEVPIETIALALEKSMLEIGNIKTESSYL